MFKLGLGLGSETARSTSRWSPCATGWGRSRCWPSTTTASGPFNVCSPETPTNAEFTKAFARAVHRPAFIFVPRWLLKVGAGPAAPELLRSLNLRPAALEALGFEFADRDIEAILATALG